MADSIEFTSSGEVPVYAGGARVIPTGNDFIIEFQNVKVTAEVTENGVEPKALVSPAVSVAVSRMTLKDVSVVLFAAVRALEQEHGEINTPFIDLLRAAEENQKRENDASEQNAAPEQVAS
ncbi:MAG: hypothetical protein AAFQ73_07965 [Pseudomonadota bacterium]